MEKILRHHLRNLKCRIKDGTTGLISGNGTKGKQVPEVGSLVDLVGRAWKGERRGEGGLFYSFTHEGSVELQMLGWDS